jgi:hypothetical protein
MKLFPYLCKKFYLYFDSFLYICLNVLVSFLIFFRHFYKIEKSSLTHLNLYTKMGKIQNKFLLVCNSDWWNWYKIEIFFNGFSVSSSSNKHFFTLDSTFRQLIYCLSQEKLKLNLTSIN